MIPRSLISSFLAIPEQIDDFQYNNNQSVFGLQIISNFWWGRMDRKWECFPKLFVAIDRDVR